MHFHGFMFYFWLFEGGLPPLFLSARRKNTHLSSGCTHGTAHTDGGKGEFCEFLKFLIGGLNLTK